VKHSEEYSVDDATAQKDKLYRSLSKE